MVAGQDWVCRSNTAAAVLNWQSWTSSIRRFGSVCVCVRDRLNLSCGSPHAVFGSCPVSSHVAQRHCGGNEVNGDVCVFREENNNQIQITGIQIENRDSRRRCSVPLLVMVNYYKCRNCPKNVKNKREPRRSTEDNVTPICWTGLQSSKSGLQFPHLAYEQLMLTNFAHLGYSFFPLLNLLSCTCFSKPLKQFSGLLTLFVVIVNHQIDIFNIIECLTSLGLHGSRF